MGGFSEVLSIRVLLSLFQHLESTNQIVRKIECHPSIINDALLLFPQHIYLEYSKNMTNRGLIGYIWGAQLIVNTNIPKFIMKAHSDSRSSTFLCLKCESISNDKSCPEQLCVVNQVLKV